jgi:hypothetical protein
MTSPTIFPDIGISQLKMMIGNVATTDERSILKEDEKSILTPYILRERKRENSAETKPTMEIDAISPGTLKRLTRVGAKKRDNKSVTVPTVSTALVSP